MSLTLKTWLQRNIEYAANEEKLNERGRKKEGRSEGVHQSCPVGSQSHHTDRKLSLSDSGILTLSDRVFQDSSITVRSKKKT